MPEEDVGEDMNNILIRPSDIRFTETDMRILSLHKKGYKIPYENIIIASLRIKDKESGEWYEPEIMDLTRDMDGEVLLKDDKSRQWRIQADMTGKTAGEILSELSAHAPFILIGRQTWFDEKDKNEFAEIADMVGLMREC